MEISARIRSNPTACDVAVHTGGVEQRLTVAAKASGQGSAVNGGELLMAALATCYCNDLYREAARLGIAIRVCEVVASARFDDIGRPAESIVYAARVESSATPAEIERLLAETDRVAEVHNTLRVGREVRRVPWTGHAS